MANKICDIKVPKLFTQTIDSSRNINAKKVIWVFWKICAALEQVTFLSFYYNCSLESNFCGLNRLLYVRFGQTLPGSISRLTLLLWKPFSKYIFHGGFIAFFIALHHLILLSHRHWEGFRSAWCREKSHLGQYHESRYMMNTDYHW